MARASDDDVKEIIIYEICRLKANASEKINAVGEYLRKNDDSGKSWLFFCGSGNILNSTSEIDENETCRQIDQLYDLVSKEFNMNVFKFTYETPKERRRWSLEALADGDLDGIIAMNCLDEGIDVPSVNNVFLLSSSTNERQFIQRRGRVLRKDKNNPGKIAKICDLLIHPPLEIEKNSATDSFMKNDIKRYSDFIFLAINGASLDNDFSNIVSKFCIGEE